MNPKFLILAIVVLEISYLAYSSAQYKPSVPKIKTEIAKIEIEQLYVHPKDATHRVKYILNHLSSSETYLDISSLKLQYIPAFVIESEKKMEGINLSTNKFSQFPSALSNRKDLRHLNLSLNYLSEIPPIIEAFESLESLDLSHNQIEALPLEIGQIKTLQSLNLNGNPIEILPNLAQCKNLHHLNVKGTNIPLIELEKLKNQMPNLHLVSDY